MHWYYPDGSKAYEVEDAKGNMRPTTLRDARKLALVPSVTTIMSIQDKPALFTWKQEQLLQAFLQCSPPAGQLELYELGYSDEEAEQFIENDYKRWKQEVLQKSRQVAADAANWGSKLHDALESAISGEGLLPEFHDVCTPILEFLDDEFPNAEWVAEKSFANVEHGFGGAVDLHCPKTNIVLDFKTKNKPADQIKKLRAYDEHHMQTAAYTKGLNLPNDTKRYNLFVGYDVKDDGNIVYTGHKLTESKDFKREWSMFYRLLQFWQLKNKYIPKEAL